MRFLFALALLADAAVMTLLVAVSGFVFGGPEGMRGETGAVLGWSAAMAGCVLCAILGIIVWRRRRQGLAIAITLLPIIVALALTFGVGEMLFPV